MVMVSQSWTAECRHHFWFLEVALASGTVSLQRLCVGIFLAFLPALIVPGFLLTASFLQLIGPLLIGQVSSLPPFPARTMRNSSLSTNSFLVLFITFCSRLSHSRRIFGSPPSPPPPPSP